MQCHIHVQSGGGWRFAHDETDKFLPDGARGNVGHCYGKCDGILSDDPDQNPLFHSWNKVKG